MENNMNIVIVREHIYDDENAGTEKFNIWWGENPVGNEPLDRDNLIRLRDRINIALLSDDRSQNER